MGVANTKGMPASRCPTVCSTGTTRLRSALMPILMTSRASMMSLSDVQPACVAGTSQGRQRELLLRGRRALHKGLAALHLVMQRRLVDLDHHRVGIDSEILNQRLGDVAHHAGLLLVG